MKKFLLILIILVVAYTSTKAQSTTTSTTNKVWYPTNTVYLDTVTGYWWNYRGVIKHFVRGLQYPDTVSTIATQHYVLTHSSGGTWGTITGTLSTQTDLNTALSGKQATLVSGTNLKTINSVTLLGSANILLQTPLVAGTDYLAPTGSAAGLTGLLSAQVTGALGFTPYNATNPSNFITPSSTNTLSNKDLTSGTNTFPTFNQNTSGTASNLSGTPALPNGTTATTQSGSDNSTKIATTAQVQAAIGLITSLPPSGTAAGELAGTYPNPTLLNSAVIGKVLTGYSSGAGTVASTDNILQAFQKINGNVVINTASIATNTTNIATNTAAIATKAAQLNLTAIKTANYTLAAYDYAIGDATAGTFTFTLPNAPTDGAMVETKMVNSSGTNTISLATQGVDVFNGGGTSASLAVNFYGVIWQYKLSNHTWYSSATNYALGTLDARYYSAASGATDAANIAINATAIGGKQAIGNYITALTGDATAAGPGTVAITFATVNSNVGGFGDASHTVTLTINAKGLITAASQTAIAITESQVTNLTTDLAAKATLGDDMTLKGLQAIGFPGKAYPIGFPMPSTSGALTSQVCYFVPVYLSTAQTITGIKVATNIAGAYTGNNFNGVGFCSVSGGTLTNVATSSNTASIWTGNGLITVPFTGTYNAAAGLYYIEILWSSSATTTAPSFASFTPSGISLSSFFGGTNHYGGTTASNTTLPTSVASSSFTNGSTLPYAIPY